MKISNNYNVSVGKNSKQEVTLKEKTQERQKKENYFAGEFHQELFENKLLQKKQEAKEKAMKIVGDAFSGDRKIDEDIQERRDKIAALTRENESLAGQIKEINEWQDALMQEYGVSAESQEHKDLELLRKEERYRKGEGEALSKEEQKRLLELKKEGLTDYQKRQREWDSQKQHFQKEMAENTKQMKEEVAVIRGVRQERLKSSPMVKAEKEKEAILDAAGREIIGMILDEAKDTIDEKHKEEKEKAQKLEEEQKKKEEIIEKHKEKKKEEEIWENMPVEEMVHMGQLKNEVRKEIENIVNEMKLVTEDIKGARVDEEI